jgi:hypothetical protein
MPKHPDDPGLLQSYAFGYGHIKALIQAGEFGAIAGRSVGTNRSMIAR